MTAYIQAGIIVILLIGVGLLLITKSKSTSSRIRLQWTGYALLIMTLFLIVAGILTYINESSHGYGH